MSPFRVYCSTDKIIVSQTHEYWNKINVVISLKCFDSF